MTAWLALCFAAAGTAAWVSADRCYAAMIKPTWNPPAWFFGQTSMYLYATMAVATWLIWHLGGGRMQGRALGVFVPQSGLHAQWTPLFFGLHRQRPALIYLVGLWLALTTTLVVFWRGRPAFGVLPVPYLAWVGFATASNLTIWRLNL